MVHISRAEHLGDYRVRFTFDDGRQGAADLRSTILDDRRPVFAPLRDVSVFRSFAIEQGALAWPGGPDIAPEYLYYLTFKHDPALHSLFGEWGYLKTEVGV